jgi:N utilization substance protein B
MRSVSPTELLQDRLEHGGNEKDNPETPYIRPYTAQIVTGVTENVERIDEVLSTYSTKWPVARMPNVDRELLRIGVWELLYNPEVDESVAVDEAVSLAARLSTDDSPAFVNGLLDRIAKLKPMLVE